MARLKGNRRQLRNLRSWSGSPKSNSHCFSLNRRQHNDSDLLYLRFFCRALFLHKLITVSQRRLSVQSLVACNSSRIVAIMSQSTKFDLLNAFLFNEREISSVWIDDGVKLHICGFECSSQCDSRAAWLLGLRQAVVYREKWDNAATHTHVLEPRILSFAFYLSKIYLSRHSFTLPCKHNSSDSLG